MFLLVRVVDQASKSSAAKERSAHIAKLEQQRDRHAEALAALRVKFDAAEKNAKQVCCL